MRYRNVQEGEFSKYDMIQAETTIDSFEKHLDEAQEAMESRNLSDSCQHLLKGMQMLDKLAGMKAKKESLDAAYKMLEQGPGLHILAEIHWRNDHE
ncbi:hypothetical protein ACIQLG_19935 [Terribacillus saccharophilus]|uniref:hypothetical protein n=1 Tax=Terribacillus saccharophilus TaxID=361277 RepID=UPI00380E3BCF